VCAHAAEEKRREATAAEEQRIAARRLARLSAIRLAQLEIPPIFAQASFENFQLHGSERDMSLQRRALDVAKGWVDGWPDVPHLQVWRGGCGTGKGHLAWSMLVQLVRRHAVRARLVKLADLVRELRARWSSGGNESGALEFYRSLDMLVIDEVSRHAFYGEPHQHLYDVVDHRLEHGRHTILTSNETAANLVSVLGQALTSRVNGSGGVVDFGEADFRSRVRR
jgi:DNA replication protein DnaC